MKFFVKTLTTALTGLALVYADANAQADLSTTITVGENRVFGAFGLTAYDGTYQTISASAEYRDWTLHGYLVQPEAAQEASLGVSYAHTFENGIEVGGGYSFVMFDLDHIGQDAHVGSAHVSSSDGIISGESLEIGWTISSTFMWSDNVTDLEVYAAEISATYEINQNWSTVANLGYSSNSAPTYNGVFGSFGLEWSNSNHLTVGAYADGYSGTSDDIGVRFAITISN